MTPITTFTLAEFTSLLCPNCDEEESYRVSRKIQNQVNAGLIHPIKKSHTGRGVHRRYDYYEIYKARVLLELERFQIPNSVLQLVATLFDDTNPGRGKSLRLESTGKQATRAKISKCMADAISNEDAILLVLNSDEAKPLMANLVRAHEFKPAWTSAIMLNLTEIIKADK